MRLAKGSRGYPGWPVLLLLLVFGGILGNWIGVLVVENWPFLGFLGTTHTVGVPALTVDLKFINVHFGVTLNVNAFTVVGLVAAYLVFRKL